MGRREHIGLAVILIVLILVSVTLTSSTTPGAGGSTAPVLITTAVTAAVSGLVFWVLRSSSVDVGICFGLTSGPLYAAASLQMESSGVLLMVLA
jgi:hypothetical protein